MVRLMICNNIVKSKESIFLGENDPVNTNFF